MNRIRLPPRSRSSRSLLLFLPRCPVQRRSLAFLSAPFFFSDKKVGEQGNRTQQTTQLDMGMGLPFNVNGERRQLPWQVEVVPLVHAVGER
eukprot:3770679-Rhodomonas_salina.3